MRATSVVVAWMLGSWLGGCAAEDASERTNAETTEPAPVPFELTSSAFESGEMIPLVHECGPPFPNGGPGENETPPLSWTAGPEGTASYAVVMRDKDFTPPDFEDGLIHWAIYDIPAEVTSLPQGIPEEEAVDDPAGAKQAEVQGSGFFGYFGPCSPNSVNTYRFTVYALPEATLDLGGDSSEINVAEVAKANALDRTSLAGES